jgi:hypothetical protein
MMACAPALDEAEDLYEVGSKEWLNRRGSAGDRAVPT